jgi:hypothetical protein
MPTGFTFTNKEVPEHPIGTSRDFTKRAREDSNL